MTRRRLLPRLPWPTVAVVLTTISGVWSILAPWMGHMGPPWPCVVAGVILLVSAVMLRVRPTQYVGWGLIVIVVGVTVVLLGRGGLIPGMTAVCGGLAAVVWRD